MRNLDELAYRALEARAALEGGTVDHLISDAIRAYLIGAETRENRGSLRALKPEPFPDGNEDLSLEIDSILCQSR